MTFLSDIAMDNRKTDKYTFKKDTYLKIADYKGIIRK